MLNKFFLLLIVFIFKILIFLNTYYQVLFMSTKQHHSQRQILDHHYANNIFFTALSTLESLKQTFQNIHKGDYKKKLFANYDRVDYSDKNLQELQSQLQTHLLILRASIISYNQQYSSQWSPPSNYNFSKILEFICSAIQIFKGNTICCKLAQDFLSIITCRYTDLYIDTVRLKGNYSPQQQLENRNNIIWNGMKAQNTMNEQQQKIKNIKDLGELQANLNIDKDSSLGIKYWVTSKDNQRYFRNEKSLITFNKNFSIYESFEEAQKSIKHPDQCVIKVRIEEDRIVIN